MWTAAGEPAVRVRRDVTAESLRSERARTAQVVTEAPPRSPLRFVVLVFLLSIPFWVAGLITGRTLSSDLPIGALMFICPVWAAAILAYREGGTVAVAELLRRSFDFDRVTDKRWYLPPLLLGPSVYGATYVLMRLTGVSVPDPEIPLLAALVATAGFWNCRDR